MCVLDSLTREPDSKIIKNNVRRTLNIEKYVLINKCFLSSKFFKVVESKDLIDTK